MSNTLYPTLPGLGYSVIKTPNFKTRIQRAVSGRTLRTGDWANPIWNFTLTYEWLDDGSLWGVGFVPNLGLSLANLLSQYNALPAALQADYNGVVGTDPANFNNTTGLQNKVNLVAVLTGYNQLAAGTQAQYNATVGGNVALYNNTPAGVLAKLALVQTLAQGSATHLRILMDFFNSRLGSADDFLLNDPTDNDITGAILIRNPADATMTQFQLVRQLAPGGLSEWVTAPNVVRAIYLNGQPASQFTLDLDTGIVTFPGAVGAQTVTADFSYYFRVTFPDSLDFENFAWQFWRLKQVKLTSVLLSTAPALCFLGPAPPPGTNVVTATGGSTPPGGGPATTPTPTPPPAVTSTVAILPSAPVISSSTPLGATVATLSVTNSDGSPFAGRLFFVAPNFDAGGVFALNGSAIIVNPAGPGVGNITGTVTDHVTIDAVP